MDCRLVPNLLKWIHIRDFRRSMTTISWSSRSAMLTGALWGGHYYESIQNGSGRCPLPWQILLQHSSVHMLVAIRKDEFTFTTEMKPILYNDWRSIIPINVPLTWTPAHPKTYIGTMQLKTEPVSEDALSPVTEDLCTMSTNTCFSSYPTKCTKHVHTYINSKDCNT